jgi:hypothetical protein
MDMISGLNEARNFPKDGAGFDVLVENIMGDGYLKKESNQRSVLILEPGKYDVQEVTK